MADSFLATVHLADPAVLVIGIGNEFRGDDAVGLVVARRLTAHAGPGLEVREASGEATELMRLWEGRARVVVVDAMRSGRPPGTVARLDVRQDWPEDGGGTFASSHALGLREAVALAKALGSLPGSLAVVGVEGATFGAGEPLTPAVAAAAEQVVASILSEAAD